MAYISPGKAAAGRILYGLAWAHADIVGPADVGGPKEVKEPSFVPVQRAFGTVGKSQCLGAISIAEGIQLVRYIVQSTVPTHSPPLSRPPLACPFEGVIDSVRMVKVVDHQATSAADKTTGDWMVDITPDPYGLTLLNLHEQAASWVAQAAVCSSRFGHVGKFLSS